MILKVALTALSATAAVFGFLNAGSEAGSAALGARSFGTSLNGEIESRLVDQGFREAVLAVAESGGQGFPVIDDDLAERAEAVRALRPLDPVPLRVLAVGKIAHAEPDRARDVLQASTDMYKRDVASNMWLVQDFARREQIDEMIRYFDRALRTNREVRTASMPAFVGLIADPEGRNLVAELVSDNPDWETAFWGEFAKNPVALENAAAFFGEGQVSFAEQPADRKAAIYANLRKVRNFETLFRLVELDTDLVSEGTAPALGALQSDGSPTGWQLNSTGLISSRYDSENAALVVEARGGALGSFAERVVRKTTQDRLEVTLAQDVPEGMRLRVSATCATDRTRVFSEVVLAAGERSASGQLADSEDCEFVSLQAHVSVERRSQGGEVAVTEMRLS